MIFRSKNIDTVELVGRIQTVYMVGDEIDFVFSANVATPTARAGVICNPAVAFTEVTATGAVQTGADFSAEVMVLVSVIAVLGAVVIAAGIVSKKLAHN